MEISNSNLKHHTSLFPKLHPHYIIKCENTNNKQVMCMVSICNYSEYSTTKREVARVCKALAVVGVLL